MADDLYAGIAVVEADPYAGIATVDKSSSAKAKGTPKRSHNVSTLGALARGAANSFFLGFPDEIAGAGRALTRGTFGNEGFAEAYKKGRDYYRDVEREDSKMRSGSRLVGQIAGGLALPTGAVGRTGAALAGRLAKEGAAYGAAYGAGEAENLGDVPSDAVTGAALGAGVGAAVGKGTNALGARLARRRLMPEPMAEVAKRLQVQPSPATVGGRAGEIAQLGFVNTPGGINAVAPVIERETQQLGQAAARAATDLGPVSTKEGAGRALVRGQQAFDRLERGRAGATYGARTQLMGGEDAPVLMAETRTGLQNIIDEFPSGEPLLNAIGTHPSIRKMATASEELTLKEATEALSHIRSEKRRLAQQGNVSDIIKRRVSELEQAVENDVMNAAKAADTFNETLRKGVPSAVDLQRAGDREYAAYKRIVGGSMKKAFQSARDDVNVAPEKVFDQFAADLREKGGNLSRARQMWANLPKGARRAFSATMFDDMGRAIPSAQDNVGDVWSSATFLTNWNKLSDEGRKLVFSDPKAKRQIDDIVRYASRLRDIDKTRNTSGTARAASSAAIVGSAVTQLLFGNVAGAAATAASPIPLYVLGKAFVHNSNSRKWLETVTKAAANDKPEVVMNLARQLPRLAAKNPAIAQDVAGLQRALQEALSGPARVAAEENDEIDGRGISVRFSGSDEFQ